MVSASGRTWYVFESLRTVEALLVGIWNDVEIEGDQSVLYTIFWAWHRDSTTIFRVR